MAPKRPKALKWIGDNLPDGRPVAFIQTVEPKDYSEEEVAFLSNDQLTAARHSGLYKEIHEKEPKATKAKAKVLVSHHGKPSPEIEQVDTPIGIDDLEPIDNAGEPATEGEG
jgi:hypothetical protein